MTASSPAAAVEWLTVAGDLDAWTSLGLTTVPAGSDVDDGSAGVLIPLIGTSIRIVAPTSELASGERGIVGWALSGVDELPPDEDRLDGLVTDVVDPASPVFADHGLGASGLDHVVISTDDLERTSTAITAATGCELKRIRDLGSMRQGFHRIGRGGLIVELVERPDQPVGPAAFWGLVLIVEDIDAACELLGPEQISPPKDAVQPGRRIATVRADVGLGLPVALMTP